MDRHQITHQQWLEATRKQLKGADIEKLLSYLDQDGLERKILYTESHTMPQFLVIK